MRKVVNEPPADQVPLANDALTKVVHRLHLQSVEDEPFIAQMVDAVSDHAMRINQLALKTSESDEGTELKFKQVHDILKAIDAKVEKNAEMAYGNDVKVKEGLKALEGIVDGHNGAIPQLRADVQNAVRDIAAVVQRIDGGFRAADGSAPTAAPAPDPGVASAHAKIEGLTQQLGALGGKCDESFRALGEAIGQIQRADSQTRINELTAHISDLSSRMASLECNGAAPPPTGVGYSGPSA